MPPKQDLRGGNQSDDSFAMSKTTFVASVSRCLFARGNQCGLDYGYYRESYLGFVPPSFRLSPNAVSEKNLTWLSRRRRRMGQGQLVVSCGMGVRKPRGRLPCRIIATALEAVHVTGKRVLLVICKIRKASPGQSWRDMDKVCR